MMLLLKPKAGTLDYTAAKHWQKTVDPSLLKVIKSTAHYTLLLFMLGSNKQHQTEIARAYA